MTNASGLQTSVLATIRVQMESTQKIMDWAQVIIAQEEILFILPNLLKLRMIFNGQLTLTMLMMKQTFGVLMQEAKIHGVHSHAQQLNVQYGEILIL